MTDRMTERLITLPRQPWRNNNNALQQCAIMQIANATMDDQNQRKHWCHAGQHCRSEPKRTSLSTQTLCKQLTCLLILCKKSSRSELQSCPTFYLLTSSVSSAGRLMCPTYAQDMLTFPAKSSGR